MLVLIVFIEMHVKTGPQGNGLARGVNPGFGR